MSLPPTRHPPPGVRPTEVAESGVAHPSSIPLSERRCWQRSSLAAARPSRRNTHVSVRRPCRSGCAEDAARTGGLQRDRTWSWSPPSSRRRPRPWSTYLGSSIGLCRGVRKPPCGSWRTATRTGASVTFAMPYHRPSRASVRPRQCLTRTESSSLPSSWKRSALRSWEAWPRWLTTTPGAVSSGIHATSPSRVRPNWPHLQRDPRSNTHTCERWLSTSRAWEPPVAGSFEEYQSLNGAC